MQEQKNLTRFLENGATIPPKRATADDIPRPADLYIELELYFTNRGRLAYRVHLLFETFRAFSYCATALFARLSHKIVLEEHG